ncbi:acylneuraminate cytidylyltransferase family protein [Hungatella hathewayi]|uniref:acylneuraminate cytidylyltransferase family protein n=1 Tax=Hungatella hathewayi TaxID=154046 RepID=UPI003565A38A
MERVAAFIPVKLNNQRLPGKNLMSLNGKPMCEYIFRTIVQVEAISEAYVYCSDEAIIPYLPEGLKFLKRDSYLDGFSVRGLEIIEHFVRDVDADIYVLTHITQPFTRRESLETALDKVLHDGYDSAFSCMELRDYCWYDGKTLNYDRKDIVLTQELEPVYMETGGFFIFRKEVFTRQHQRIGSNPYLYAVDRFEAVDVDTKEDFEFAETVARFLESGQQREI